MSASYTELTFVGCILFLPFLYESSQRFRPKNVQNLLIASYFCKRISKIIGLNWILQGKEQLEKDQACIIVSNHQSSIDILGMFDIWRIMGKCTVISKREVLFYSGPFGLAAWLCGLIFIPRMQSDKAKSIMNNAVENIKRDKIKLWVFPEGTRRNEGKIHPFKKGAFHMAISNQLPILPLVYSRYYFLDKEVKRFDHGQVIIHVLPQVETKGLTINDIDTLMEKVNRDMSEKFAEISKEVTSCNV
ncbi:unnamed protein product [Acanthoscelides obtectus]|uniref:1-acyl-sn-glycerol-3-phosphate acyltransferase n=1 Tax=Acanthoscelides obtectus TaxID=200917 RepID=A0A9P0KHL5_ACAOB|nr:unnamed protein product [Acanthoscelides obtectus]CAK1660871.1 1-acyl-sn-glycerol-3-phosphate acyltransferase alpha [Acanthoscelides obtectus]